MESFFKKLFSFNKKENAISQGRIVPLETQIDEMRKIGFSLIDGLDIDFLINEFDRPIFEEDPYGCLLFAYGSEHEDINDNWIQNSDDILSFDTECIEDNGSYIQILEKLKKLSKGIFEIGKIRDSIDIEQEKSWVSFDYEDKNYKWDLEFDNDWFDIKLIDKINELLKVSGKEKRFYTYSPDQNLIVVFLDEDGVKILNQITGFNFE